MIIKALILTTLLVNEPAIVALPPERIEARKRNKGNKGRRRGGSGLR